MRELKACPFCGHYSTIISQHSDHDYYFVECGSCESEGPPHWSEDEAVNAWNTRPEVSRED